MICVIDTRFSPLNAAMIALQSVVIFVYHSVIVIVLGDSALEVAS
jgi:hypothetical protein